MTPCRAHTQPDWNGKLNFMLRGVECSTSVPNRREKDKRKICCCTDDVTLQPPAGYVNKPHAQVPRLQIWWDINICLDFTDILLLNCDLGLTIECLLRQELDLINWVTSQYSDPASLISSQSGTSRLPFVLSTHNIHTDLTSSFLSVLIAHSNSFPPLNPSPLFSHTISSTTIIEGHGRIYSKLTHAQCSLRARYVFLHLIGRVTTSLTRAKPVQTRFSIIHQTRHHDPSAIERQHSLDLFD